MLSKRKPPGTQLEERGGEGRWSWGTGDLGTDLKLLMVHQVQYESMSLRGRLLTAVVTIVGNDEILLTPVLFISSV